jgi:hypothetical protein
MLAPSTPCFTSSQVRMLTQNLVSPLALLNLLALLVPVANASSELLRQYLFFCTSDAIIEYLPLTLAPSTPPEP